MKGQKMVKIFSVLMILCCLFAVCEGALSMLKLNDEKKICDSEIKDREMQIVQLENGIASLEKGKAGYESNLSALRKGKAAYETNKNAYEIGKAALDQRAAELAAAKEAGTIDEASAAAAAAQLETLFAELQKNKANLEEYEKIKAEAEEYEAGKAQVDALITKISQDEKINLKLLSGLDPVSAAREALSEEKTEKDLSLRKKFYIYAGTVAAAIFAFIASILGIGAAEIPDMRKIRGGISLGLLSFLLAAAAATYSFFNEYTSDILFISSLGSEALLALLYEISVIRYKNILLALIGA